MSDRLRFERPAQRFDDRQVVAQHRGVLAGRHGRDGDQAVIGAELLSQPRARILGHEIDVGTAERQVRNAVLC